MHAALDLSDSLTGDLGHILAASGVGADLRLADLPLAPALAALPEAERHTCLLAGGDDYDLLFTAPMSARDAVLTAALGSETPVTRMGAVTEALGQRLLGAPGLSVLLRAEGFDHFV